MITPMVLHYRAGNESEIRGITLKSHSVRLGRVLPFVRAFNGALKNLPPCRCSCSNKVLTHITPQSDHGPVTDPSTLTKG